MTVKFKYYRAEGEKAESAILHLVKTTREREDAINTIVNEYKADGLIGGIDGVPTGFMFDSKAGVGHIDGLRRESTIGDKSGIVYNIYVTDFETESGRNVFNRFVKMAEQDATNYICSQFSIKTDAVTSVKIDGLNKILFKLKHYDENPLPTIPRELIEITEAEFKGLTQ